MSKWREAARCEYEKQREALFAALAQCDEAIEQRPAIVESIRTLDAGALALRIVEAAPEPPAPPSASRRRDVPTVRDMILEEAKKAYPNPIRATAVARVVEGRLGRRLHPKTAGMTLNRMSQDGLVRRINGRDWVYSE